MKRILMSITVVALALSVPACGGASGGKAEQAAAIAKKIKAQPDKAEDIVKEAGMTPEQYQQLLREVAGDPDMSAAYANAMGK